MKSSLNSFSLASAFTRKRRDPAAETRLQTVPASTSLNTSAKDGFVFVFDPTSEAANRYRNILDEILGRTWPRKLMLVTSPASGDGKTLTSVNLALALEEKKHSVLLVELTLNRPRYRFVFGAPPSTRGVESVLKGEAAPDEVTFQLGETRVAVMSVSKPMPDNSLLQRNPHLDKMLEYGKANYDWTILDVPSVRESRAVSELAAQAEPVLLVARSRQTKVEVFRKATHTLGRNLDYVILNDIAS